MNGYYLVNELMHYCNVSLKSCARIGRRVIPYYDLTFVLKGSMTYINDGQIILLEENDAILSPPGTVQERLAGSEEVRYVSFNFTLLPEKELCLPPHLRQVISREIRAVISAFSQSHISPLYHSTEKVVNLLNYILFEILDIHAFESNNEAVIAMIKYIDAQIFTPISLSALAEHVHLSKEYVAHVFKKERGKTVIEYVNERKMLIAKDLIQANKLSLQQVAQTLGFSNYSYFSKVFKRHFNTSPVHFKNT